MIEIFDGAMGTMLQARGLRPGECPELLNVERPEMVAAVHRAYVDAGATIVESNTFGASRLKLAEYGLAGRVRELNVAAVQVAKTAVHGRAKVAGAMGPTGQFVKPLGDLDFEDAYAAYREQAAALAEGGADFILVETVIDIQEARAALLAAKDATALPVIVQLSFSDNARTVTGTDAQTAAITLDSLGADIIGVNCSLGPEQLVPIVATLAANTDKPVSVQPNAGLPQLIDGQTIFPMTPADFAQWVPKLIAAGATYIGGCCGTTPAHIRALADAAHPCHPAPRRPLRPCLRLTSRSRTVVIDADGSPLIIGERINPSGRKVLAAEIKGGSFVSVKREALEQTKAGAAVLDVNMGVVGVDAVATMRRAVNELAQITPTPLSIDTADAAALEAALRAYPGRALVNSVSDEKRCDEFLALAKRYGAAVLCLPVNSKGIPKTATERAAIVGNIIAKAKAHGLRERDCLLDALVLTVAAAPRAALEAVDTLRLYRERFPHCPTTMGLSNISFGLPERPLVNTTFLAMALAAGLTAPILNPYAPNVCDVFTAARALLGCDANGREFSKLMRQRQSTARAPSVPAKSTGNLLADLKLAVKEGMAELAADLLTKAVKAGRSGEDITNRALTAAMNELGDDFGAGRVFLPEVLLAAEAMRTAFDKLQELLPQSARNTLGTFVLATVKGDVHDLGKNIVGALLKNSGFALIDLGKDVAAATVVQAAIDHDADIVGLSALMTTTMPALDATVAALRAAGVTVPVMVGGAAVTAEYARDAGADCYAPDGITAVRLAKQLVAG